MEVHETSQPLSQDACARRHRVRPGFTWRTIQTWYYSRCKAEFYTTSNQAVAYDVQSATDR